MNNITNNEDIIVNLKNLTDCGEEIENNQFENNLISTNNSLSIFNDDKLRVIFLGGAEEIGRSCALYIYKDSAFIIDCGSTNKSFSLELPEDKLEEKLRFVSFGQLDIIFKYKDILKAILITHAHEDHIGGIKYLYQELMYKYKCTPIIYCGRYASEYLKSLERNKDINFHFKINKIRNGQVIYFNPSLSIKCISITHTTPDSFMYSIIYGSKNCSILHTGDWKIDLYENPKQTCWNTLIRENKNCVGIICDSTRGGTEGFSTSEQNVLNSFEDLLQTHMHKRIFVTAFASNIVRIINMSKIAIEKYNKNICALGYSVYKNISMAVRCNLMKDVVNIDFLDRSKDKKHNIKKENNLIFVSGCQGEGSLKKISEGKGNIVLNENDVIIFSSDIIPGNEKNVYYCLKLLLNKGVKVIHRVLDNKYHDFHTSGHGFATDISFLINLIKPKNFISVHGNYIQCLQNNKNALKCGLLESNTFIPANGDMLVFNEEGNAFQEKITKFQGIYLLEDSNIKINLENLKTNIQIAKKGIIQFLLSKLTKKVLKVNYLGIYFENYKITLDAWNNYLVKYSTEIKDLHLQEQFTFILLKIADKNRTLITNLPVITIFFSNE